MKKMWSVNVVTDDAQRVFLAQEAEKLGTSVSAYIRLLVAEKQQERKDQESLAVLYAGKQPPKACQETRTESV